MSANRLAYSGTQEFLANVGSLDDSDQSAHIAELQSAITQGLVERPNDPNWDTLSEERSWMNYYYRQKRKPREDSTPFTFAEHVKLASHVLCGDPACRTMLDFGAFMATPDQIIADYFPDVNVIGLDRSTRVKFLNEQEFSAPNLHFVAEDIFSFIRANDLRGALMTHVRTTSLLYPAAVSLLYAEAARAGIKHIIGIEYSGYSRELHRFFPFEETLTPSAVLRDGMFIHDYPNIAEACGYSVRRIELKRVPMRKAKQQDMHALCFIASLA